jgi:hypothetical protein
MATLSRVFFTISEAAARWGYSVADIAGWAHQGQLEIVTGIAPVQSGETTLAGIVVIAAADILPMFRRSGLGPRELAVNRLRLPQETEWRMITNPAEGVMVSFDDLMITALEMARFEIEHDIFGRKHAGRGPDPKYDWDAFWRAVAVRVHERGVPELLKEFVDEFSNWFMDQSPTGDCPSDSVIRKKLSPLWRQLRDEK